MNSRGEHGEVTHIRDPIYDEIHLSQLELDILDRSEIQRLRQIKQLGAVTRVYPSATHTRFSHSLGVMHLAGVMANRVGLSDSEVTEARIAGLLHDTGHGPFSHTSEQVISEDVFKHENRSCQIAREICKDLPVDEDNIVDYISGESKPSVVAGTIDADRLDYIVRDSLFTSVEHGQIDVNSVVRFTTSVDGDIGFDQKAIPSINDMLSARLRMRRVVYRYDTVRHLASLVRRAMERYVEKNSVEDMIKHDDYTMHSKLVENNNKFYKMMINRNLSHQRFKFDISDIEKNKMREISEISNSDMRNMISERMGKDQDDIIISSPYIPKSVVENTRIISNGNSKVLSECSDFPDYIRKEAWRSADFQVYVDNPKQNTRELIMEEIDNI